MSGEFPSSSWKKDNIVDAEIVPGEAVPGRGQSLAPRTQDQLTPAQRKEELALQISRIDPQLARVFREYGVQGLVNVMDSLEEGSGAGGAESLTRQAATFHPRAKREMERLEDARLNPQKHPDSAPAQLQRVFQALDEVSGGARFFEEMGASRGTDGMLHIEGVDFAFQYLRPLPGGKIFVGITKRKKGNEGLIIVSVETKRPVNAFPYAEVAEIGEYIIGRRVDTGAKVVSVLIDPNTGRVWFGQNGEYTGFEVKGNELLAVRRSPGEYGRTKDPVPPPVKVTAEQPKVLPRTSGQKALPESSTDKSSRGGKPEDFIS